MIKSNDRGIEKNGYELAAVRITVPPLQAFPYGQFARENNLQATKFDIWGGLTIISPVLKTPTR